MKRARTLGIDLARRIKAINDCPKGRFGNGRCGVGTEVQSYLFAKKEERTIAKAEELFKKERK